MLQLYFFILDIERREIWNRERKEIIIVGNDYIE